MKEWATVRFPDLTPPTASFVFAKWASIAATAIAPLLLVVAAIKQSKDTLLFAVAAVFVVPSMAGTGYVWLIVTRSFIQAQQNQSADVDYFPSHWSLPFRVINWLYRQQKQQLGMVNSPGFCDAFIVLWAGGLVLWTVTAVIIASVQD